MSTMLAAKAAEVQAGALRREPQRRPRRPQLRNRRRLWGRLRLVGLLGLGRLRPSSSSGSGSGRGDNDLGGERKSSGSGTSGSSGSSGGSDDPLGHD